MVLHMNADRQNTKKLSMRKTQEQHNNRTRHNVVQLTEETTEASLNKYSIMTDL